VNVQTIASQDQPLSMSMSTSPVITILTPVCNGLPYITETADSIFSQSVQNWQWVISDNGSTDGSRDYLRRLQCLADQRISVFFQSENLGIFGNLNFLCQRAQAPLVQILCADDYLATPDSLSLILATWRATDTLSGVIRWNGGTLLNLQLPSIVEPLNSQILFFLHGNIMGNLSNACARKEALLRAGNFSQTYPYAGDFEYWARFAQSNNLVISDCEYVVVRSHPGQASKHLNINGELYIQLSVVTSQIYSRIKIRGFFGRLLLRAAGTLVYDSQYRSMAILHRNRSVMWRSLEVSNASKQYLLSWFWRTCVFVFSLGGRLGKSALLSLTYRMNRLPGISP
jgi:glycosyltransferase involved in cell wall biosynthesis